MKRNSFNFPTAYLQEMAKRRYRQMTGNTDHWDEIVNAIKDIIDPRCEYIVYDRSEISPSGDSITVAGETFHCDLFANMPDEIIGDIAIYAMTAGEISTETAGLDGILNETLLDIALTAYIDAMRNALRDEFQESYIVSGSIAPGIEGMPAEEIASIDRILDLSSLGITLNEQYMMVPQKSTAGMFMFFKEEHPVNTNSCATCMARGKGCDFCIVGKDKQD